MVEKDLECIIRKGVKEYMKKVKRPYALFLSGGLDSAFLAYLIEPDVVLTCRFPYGKKYDEYNDSKKIVKYLGLKQITITPTKKDFYTYLPDALRMFRPITHFSLVPLYMLFKAASNFGYDRVISAEGPDEYLGGYASYSFITHEQKLYNQPELQSYKLALDRYLGTPMERFAKTIPCEPSKLKPYWDKYDTLLSKMGYSDLKVRGIEEMELALAEGWRVKLHYPYMTKEIEEFCFRKVPDNMKINGFTTKWILRKIAEKYLPKSVVWRKNKIGGPVAPIGKWLGEKDEFSKDKYLKLQWKIKSQL